MNKYHMKHFKNAQAISFPYAIQLIHDAVFSGETGFAI